MTDNTKENIKKQLNLEAIIGARHSYIVTERYSEATQGTNKYISMRVEPECARVLSDGWANILYTSGFRFHGWFPDGNKILLSHGRWDAMLSNQEYDELATLDYGARIVYTTSSSVMFEKKDIFRPYKEAVFTCDIEGNVDMIDEKTYNLNDISISPDGRYVAYVTRGFNESVHTHNKFHLRLLDDDAERREAKDLTQNTGQYASYMIPGPSDFRISWSTDSRWIALLEKGHLKDKKEYLNSLHIITPDGRVKEAPTLSDRIDLFDQKNYLKNQGGYLTIFSTASKSKRTIPDKVDGCEIHLSPDRNFIGIYDKVNSQLRIRDIYGKLQWSKERVAGFELNRGFVHLLNVQDNSKIECKTVDYEGDQQVSLWHDLPPIFQVNDNYRAGLSVQPEVKD